MGIGVAGEITRMRDFAIEATRPIFAIMETNHFAKEFKMKWLPAMTAASIFGISLVPATVFTSPAIQSAPLDLARESLEGPLRDYVVVMETSKSVRDTVSILKKEFEQRNFIVKGVINHQKIAKSQGLEIPPNTALLVGLPSFEAPIIKANPVGSLFVPLTVAVWKANEKTFVAYWNPKTDFGRNLGTKNNKDADNAINRMTSNLDEIVRSAR